MYQKLLGVIVFSLFFTGCHNAGTPGEKTDHTQSVQAAVIENEEEENRNIPKDIQPEEKEEDQEKTEEIQPNSRRRVQGLSPLEAAG